MNNIFNTLKNSLPVPSQKDSEALKNLEKPDTDIAKVRTETLVSQWKKDNDPSKAAELLKRMKPTISAAMNSYAPGMDQQLAIKAANLTLSALKSYDPSYNTAPATHVFHNLKRLSRFNARNTNIIQKPEGLLAEEKRARAAFDKFSDDKGREPSMAELADVTGFSVKKLNKLLNTTKVVSESSTLSEDSQKDTQTMSNLTDNDYFEYVYSSVDPINQKIMEWSSGNHGMPLMSNNDIAAKLRISAAAVSQRKANIQKLMSDVRSLI